MNHKSDFNRALTNNNGSDIHLLNLNKQQETKGLSGGVRKYILEPQIKEEMKDLSEELMIKAHIKHKNFNLKAQMEEIYNAINLIQIKSDIEYEKDIDKFNLDRLARNRMVQNADSLNPEHI